MFAVLSNPRKSNLYLIIALAIALVVILAFVVPSIAAPEATVIPVTGMSEASDYYQRHPELRAPVGIVIDMTGDFALRHPEWASREQNVTIPVSGNSETLDYYQRHPELRVSATITVNKSDYFARHPELRASNESNDLSDYFLRH